MRIKSGCWRASARARGEAARRRWWPPVLALAARVSTEIRPGGVHRAVPDPAHRVVALGDVLIIDRDLATAHAAHIELRKLAVFQVQ